MVPLRACPKCRLGDLVLARDMYGKYIKCMQCGYLNDYDDNPAVHTVIQKQASKIEPPLRVA